VGYRLVAGDATVDYQSVMVVRLSELEKAWRSETIEGVIPESPLQNAPGESKLNSSHIHAITRH
jgi:hypothetical protein